MEGKLSTDIKRHASPCDVPPGDQVLLRNTIESESEVQYRKNSSCVELFVHNESPEVDGTKASTPQLKADVPGTPVEK